jgi:hypothetical protein
VDVTMRPNLKIFREWYEEHPLVSSEAGLGTPA